MTDVYIHVGMAKTGTKFLQLRCFPHLKGVHLLCQVFRTPATGVI